MSPPGRLARRATAGFVAIALAVGVVVSVGAVWIADAFVRTDLVGDAEETARLVQRAVVTSLERDPETDPQEHFAAVLLPQVQAETLVRVKVWEHASRERLRLVYSDLPELIGQEKKLRPDRADLLGTSGTLVLAVPDDAAHRTEFVAGAEPIEVFTAFSTDGRDYLLESYFATTTGEKSQRLRAHVLPVMLGGMLLFALAMLPLAATLGRRLSAAERERMLLLDRASQERENERARLGQRLHDGVVQDLAGASLALSTLAVSTNPDQRRLEAVAGILRRDVQALRGLLDDLVPADLTWHMLDGALRQLAEEEGVPATVVVSEQPPGGAAATALVYRAGRELLHNVARHADARSATISVSRDETATVRLTVSDDGVGFDPGSAVEAGHVGLRVVEHAARGMGGGLDVVSAPGEGTIVSMRIADS